MYSRWFNVLVVVLWLSTMGWLVYEKILPPLWLGRRPDYERILQARRGQPPVGWQLRLNDRPVGWALSTTDSRPNGLTEIRSFVHFERLPLAQLAPGWLQALMRLVEGPSLDQPIDAESTLWIDPLNRLARFDSSVGFVERPELVHLQGTMEGSYVRLSVRSGDFLYQTKAAVPSDALMADAFSPQTTLPDLRRGQTWNAPSFSPLRPPNCPIQVLQAEVVGLEPVSVAGRIEQLWLVEYRSDSGAVLGEEENVHGRLWVRQDGTVVRQQASLFNAVLDFVRMDREKTRRWEMEVARRRAKRQGVLPLPNVNRAPGVPEHATGRATTGNAP